MRRPGARPGSCGRAAGTGSPASARGTPRPYGRQTPPVGGNTTIVRVETRDHGRAGSGYRCHNYLGPISPSEYIPEYIQYSMRSKYASNTIRLHHLHICSTRLRLVAARMHSPWAGPISTNQSALASLFLFVRILSKTSLITY